MSISRAHLLPGAGLPCPELDVAGNQLIPTCRDTDSCSLKVQKAGKQEGPHHPSAHLGWGAEVRVPWFPPVLLEPQGSQAAREAVASLSRLVTQEQSSYKCTGNWSLGLSNTPEPSLFLIPSWPHRLGPPQQSEATSVPPLPRTSAYLEGSRDVPGLPLCGSHSFHFLHK
jgi:hypothetical protein